MAASYGTEAVTRPIFKPLRDKFRVFGIPVGRFFVILAIAIALVGIAAGTGSFQHTVQASYSASELTTLKNDYTSVLTALQALEQQRAKKAVATYEELDLTSTQKETVAKAKELGITASMTTEDAEALVPRTHSVNEPVVPDPIRYIFIVGLPVVVMFVLFMETNRTSMWQELRRCWRWLGSQKTYRNRPIDFVERETGKTYWDALADAESGR